jgi:hypothetical protein
MKLALLALLSAGTAALCQAPSTPKVDPDKLFQIPQRFSEQAPGFTPPAMENALTAPLRNPTVLLPPPRPQNPQIDPKIIVRPPWPRGENRQKGEDMSSNQYPNLRFLPLHGRVSKPDAGSDASPRMGRVSAR